MALPSCREYMHFTWKLEIIHILQLIIFNDKLLFSLSYNGSFGFCWGICYIVVCAANSTSYWRHSLVIAWFLGKETEAGLGVIPIMNRNLLWLNNFFGWIVDSKYDCDKTKNNKRAEGTC